MCVINNSYQFIFVHVPKAAGTSVTNALSQYTSYCDIEVGGTAYGEAIQGAYMKRFGLNKHSTSAEIHSVTGAVIWNKYFSFSFVRNPFARCLSTYHFLRKLEKAAPEFAKRMQEFKSFDEYVLSDIWDETNGPGNIFRPQISWLRASPGTTDLLVDYVGKVESMEADITHILDVIGIPASKRLDSKVPYLNKSKPSSPLDIKNEEVIKKIVSRYKADFKVFGYSTDIAQASE